MCMAKFVEFKKTGKGGSSRPGGFILVNKIIGYRQQF